MPVVKWVQWQGYAGLRIAGGPQVEPPAPAAAASHAERAFYLVARLEAPRWGAVQGYDGAGLSGGPLHSIAVLPRGGGQQGSLVALLQAVHDACMETQVAQAELSALMEAFGAAGVQLDGRGQLVERATGQPVPGPALRDLLAPPNGQVPQRGADRQRAQRWCELFHALLGHPETWATQKRFALDTLLHTQKPLERSVYEGLLGRPVASPWDLSVQDSPPGGLTSEMDLSLCVYHAYSVNAPAVAARCLRELMERVSPAAPEFPAALIAALGRCTHGRFADQTDGQPSRYDRTRRIAQRSRLWPPALFAAAGLMPRDLPDAPRRRARGRDERRSELVGLSPGASGEAVLRLQKLLTALGYRPGELDGQYGALTRRAVQRLQRDNGLRVTGRVTASTARVLRSAPSQDAQRGRTVPGMAAENRVMAFLRAPLRDARYALQRDALASYFQTAQGEDVAFCERVARTAEWLLEQGVREQDGENRGPWVDFIRILADGPRDLHPPWCAYFVSACLRIARFCGPYDVEFATGGRATGLYLDAPETVRVAREAVARRPSVRGLVFVRTRTSSPPGARDSVLRGRSRRGHTGIVVDRLPDGTLLCIAGNSSGVGHARVSGSGAVAYEQIGAASPHAQAAHERLVGLLDYGAVVVS